MQPQRELEKMRRRPVLRYHGGKYMLAKWIISHFPAHRTYTEAYGGAASVLLRKEPTYAEVYNDLDGEVCSLFRVLRDPSRARELRRLLELTPFAREEFEVSYLPDGDPIEQARRTITRSFMGFGSAAHAKQATGFRANCDRSYTIPAHDWANYPEALEFFTRRLRGIIIECRPATKILTHFDRPTSLHYVDPPYVRSSRGKRHEDAYRFEMTDAEHSELSATLHGLAGMVALSGYRSDLYDSLYVDWRRVERPALADGARPRTECLWLNPACVAENDSTPRRKGAKLQK